jgi:hypothetical protein
MVQRSLIESAEQVVCMTTTCEAEVGDLQAIIHMHHPCAGIVGFLGIEDIQKLGWQSRRSASLAIQAQYLTGIQIDIQPKARGGLRCGHSWLE